MPSVFLSHSSHDKPFVRQLAEHLRQDPNITVWLDEGEIAPGDNIVAKIAEGLDSDFVLFILSPDSVASNWVKEEWTDAFWEQTNQGQVKLAGVLYRDCAIPPLIRNKRYFDLRTNHPEGFRQIHTWLLTERPVRPEHVNLLPTQPPLFIGRESELADLKRRLQPGKVLAISGGPGRGKTTLALQFAHQYKDQFAAVYWLPCESDSAAGIAGDLQRQLGLSITGDLPLVLSELRTACAQRRCLLVLDNAEVDDLGAFLPGGAASVLVTTRQPGLRFLRNHDDLRLELFTEEQCFALFQEVLGPERIKGKETACRELFQRAGYLPLAIDLAAGAMKYDSYTFAELAHFPADVTARIRQTLDALPPEHLLLLQAMAACAAEGFRLSLAAGLLALDIAAALAGMRYLKARSLVDEMDQEQRRYRLHALIREVADGSEFAQDHAEAIHQQFKGWQTNWQICEQDLPDFQLALSWAVANRPSFAESLALNGFALTERIGHLSESFEIADRMGRAAEQRADKDWAQAWCGNQALILKAWGQLEEALALHKKEEALCLELGNKNSLQVSYGNQAGILQLWGRLEEALALQKKKEALCLELGDKDGLQRTYGNQALILGDWGRLEEALTLHKKKETLCLELGNKDSLWRSYGNQARILRDWERLEEALTLYKKQEALCLELGNKAGLGYCYWNLGLLARAQNDPKTEHAKLTAALALFTELNMPRQRDAVAAELAKTRTATAS
jgi:hypothetical protein